MNHLHKRFDCVDLVVDKTGLVISKPFHLEKVYLIIFLDRCLTVYLKNIKTSFAGGDIDENVENNVAKSTRLSGQRSILKTDIFDFFSFESTKQSKLTSIIGNNQVTVVKFLKNNVWHEIASRFNKCVVWSAAHSWWR